MEKVQALGAASQSFAQLRRASQNAAAEIAVARRVASRPSALAASPVRVLARMLARMLARIVRESSAKLGESSARDSEG